LDNAILGFLFFGWLMGLTMSGLIEGCKEIFRFALRIGCGGERRISVMLEG